MQKSRQKSPSGHHRTTLLGYILTTKARIDNRKKVVKQQYVLHVSHNMVNFGALAAEIEGKTHEERLVFKAMDT